VAAQRRRNVSLTLVGSRDARTDAPPRLPNGSLDWSALMARAQDGDRTAYRTLLEDIAPYLRSLAARCFKDAGEIEDAVQDVLLTVHAVRHAYDPGRPFGPWLVAIANRRYIDRLRHQTRAKLRDMALAAQALTFAGDAANFAPDGSESLPEESVLREAIENLPPDQRQAIKLLKLEELSLKEASVRTGRSVAALKVATHRAIANLRKLLRAGGAEP
jgi:RNA polymerase sigma-70 factor (ECF subfamily)